MAASPEMTPPHPPRPLLERLFAIDPRALAVFRMGTAAILLVDLAQRWRYLEALYSDDGVLPRAFVSDHVTRIALPVHMFAGSSAYQGALFLLAGAFAALLLVGYRTRLATLVSFLLVASIQVRNPLVVDYGDQMVRLFLFWSIFLPLGSCWSVDAWRRGTPRPRRVLTVASAALLLQVATVYFFTVLEKSGSDWRGDWTAVRYTLHVDWWLRPFGAWLLRDFDGALEAGTALTVALEFVGPLLLFSPVFTSRLRIVVVSLFILFQAGLGVSIVLGLMPFICSLMMLIFLPPGYWRTLERSRPVTALAGALQRAAGRLLGASGSAPQRRFAIAEAPGVRALGSLGLAALLAYVVLYNAVAVGGGAFPQALDDFGYWLGIRQRWTMYAPNVPRHDGWYVIPAVLADGSRVNLWETGPDLDWAKPEWIYRHHRDVRWASFEFNLSKREFDKPETIVVRERYAEWLCRDWNAKHPVGRSVVSLELVFMEERTPPSFERVAAKPRLLYRHVCGGAKGAAPAP